MPAKFFDNLFQADWSRGQLLILVHARRAHTARTDRAEFVHGGRSASPTSKSVLTVSCISRRGGHNDRRALAAAWRGTVSARARHDEHPRRRQQPQPLELGWAAIEKVKATMGAGFGEGLRRSRAAPPRHGAGDIYEMQRRCAAERRAAAGAHQDAT
jgi:hypothetical protein